MRARSPLPLMLAGLLGASALAGAACSTKDGAGDSPGAAAGSREAGGGPNGDGPGAGAEPIDAGEPAAACPRPFDVSGPKAGLNEGFTAGGQARAFHLLLPPDSFTGPRPLLFAFHGTTETGSRFLARAKLADFAARGFIVVAPDAVGNGTFWPVWDAMRAPGTESQPNADVALFDRLLTCTAASYAVDKDRVFATGHSAGGIFTNRLLRSRSSVLAGGIVGSGVFDFTASGEATPLEPMLVVVTWGGDNDTYRGTTPNGVSVPAFSFVEQASLASKHYAADANVAHARCRGDNLGHAWLPLNDWFVDLLLSHPKGTPASSFALPQLPPGARAACSVDPYELARLPDMTCPSTTRAGCTEACQLFADCAVENRTVGPSLQGELSKIGFTQASCAGCVQRCQAGATTQTDAAALSCFSTRQAAATCGPGIEGATPLFQAINECCKGRSGSNLCVDLCTTLNGNSVAKAFFPTCQQIVP
ncbi:MAG: prolyl oligopeptidase family serine peptidase [Labilithrix sp.]|nr:prolyl oligopeptidase family serine peptidase [Labilithrix sp.]